jgi:hypothetical protein
VIGKLDCPQLQEPFHLLFPGAVDRTQVEIDPVLHLLAVRDSNEQQKLGLVARDDEAFLVPGLVRIVGIFDEVENLGPED